MDCLFYRENPTDLLGDAIESALSETGGTKDIGLFRTPDHVRQFMTAIIEPSFDDLIFDIITTKTIQFNYPDLKAS